MERLILEMTPSEARRRALSVNAKKGDEFLCMLLWFRASAEDPAGMLGEIAQPADASDKHALSGIFKAWIPKDAAGALTAAGQDSTVRDACINEWAAYDPIAAARAAEAVHSLPIETLAVVAGQWLCRDPAAALHWIENLSDADLAKSVAAGRTLPLDSSEVSPAAVEAKIRKWRDDTKGKLLRQWVHGDPVAGFAATAATTWGLPISGDRQNLTAPWNRADDWIANSFSTFANFSPELASAAAAALPTECLTEGIAASLARPLEEAEPGAGIRFANTLPDGPLRDAALGTCAVAAAERGEFAEATAIVESLGDGNQMQMAAAGVINYWTPVDPYATKAWLTKLAPSLTLERQERLQETFSRKANRAQ